MKQRKRFWARANWSNKRFASWLVFFSALCMPFEPRSSVTGKVEGFSPVCVAGSFLALIAFSLLLRPFDRERQPFTWEQKWLLGAACLCGFVNGTAFD